LEFVPPEAVEAVEPLVVPVLAEPLVDSVAPGAIAPGWAIKAFVGDPINLAAVRLGLVNNVSAVSVPPIWSKSCETVLADMKTRDSSDSR
jgi:hypothetical protein